MDGALFSYAKMAKYLGLHKESMIYNEVKILEALDYDVIPTPEEYQGIKDMVGQPPQVRLEKFWGKSALWNDFALGNDSEK
jgi:hypothetical protein